MANESGRSSSGILFAGVAIAVTTFVVVTTMIVVRNAYTPLPFEDSWFEWRRYLSLGNYFSFFFSEHNEHRIAVPRLFFLVDRFVFHARNVFPLICSLLFQFGTCVWLYKIGRRTGQFNLVSRVLLACAIITALFSAQQFPNLVEGFQIQFTVLYFLVCSSVLAMLRAADRLLTRAAQKGGRAGFWFAVSAMCALAASYSSANGLLCWPLLLVLAIWLQMPRKYRFALAAGMVAVTVLYMWGYTTPPRHSRPIEELTHNFPGVLIRAATFLGSVTEGIYAGLSNALGLSSVSRIVVAATFGFAGMALTAWAAILLWRKRDRFTNGHAGAVLIAIFVVFTAFMVGLGRGFLPVSSAMDARYKSHALVFWIAVGAFYWKMVEPRMPRLLFNAGVAALIVSFTPVQLFWLPYSKQVGATYREIESAIGADVFDAPVWRKSYPFAPGESAIIGPVDYLRQNHLSLFTEAWTGWTGQPLNALFAIDRSNSCQVSVESMTAVDTQVKPGWRVSGRASQPGTIVLADPSGRVAGVVRNSDGASWKGYVAGAEARTLKAYVLEPDGHSICGQ